LRPLGGYFAGNLLYTRREIGHYNFCVTCVHMAGDNAVHGYRVRRAACSLPGLSVSHPSAHISASRPAMARWSSMTIVCMQYGCICRANVASWWSHAFPCKRDVDRPVWASLPVPIPAVCQCRVRIPNTTSTLLSFITQREIIGSHGLG